MLGRDTVEQILSKGFADKLDELVIDCGSIQFSRRQMVDELGCANFIAAARLNKVLKRLQIGTVKQLYNVDPLSLARSKGVGEASIFVALSILDFSKYDVTLWWSENEIETKFLSFKKRAIRRSKKYGHNV